MQSFYLSPGNFDLLLVSGTDAVRFLQGQLTCDVETLADGDWTLGAACNNKGRVHATFTLVRQGADCFLVLNQGLGAVLLQALGKFLPFYKCTMKDVGSDLHCSGVAGTEGAALLEQLTGSLPSGNSCRLLEQGWICRHGPTYDQYLVCTRPGAPLQQTLAEGLTHGTLAQWHGLGMGDGHFPFAVEDAEQYTPQELHLDRHGHVSFTKGCYTGQEIVARMHYRGKPKKELYRVDIPASSGSETAATSTLTTTEGNPVNVIKQTMLPDGTQRCLVLLPVGMAGQTLMLSQPDFSGLPLHPF